MLIRTRVAEIREMGRATRGVTLIALDEDHVTGLQRIVETDDDGGEGGGPAQDAGAGES